VLLRSGTVITFQNATSSVEEAARGAHEPAFVAARVDRQRPWSAMDMADLFDFHETGSSVEDIADYLCRTVEEVQAKIDEVERQIAAAVRS
jgi:hypothetical protein